MKKIITIYFCMLFAFVCLSGIANSQTISTIAGTSGAGAFSGDNGPASSAQLNSPLGVTVDGAGNIYVVDYLNQRIRKIDHATNIISTVAGNGTAGYNGDNSAATAAELNSPYSVAIDNSGNLYIADQGNNVIRKVDVNGIITTIAGTANSGYNGDGILATSAQISNPMCVAVDAYSNVYIADYGNNRIRKIDASTGLISTVAGNGSSGFSGDNNTATSCMLNSPTGVAVDASGNIYIADNNNQRIRKVDVNTSNISTVAGNGTGGFSGDENSAITAQLNNPVNVTVDASGNLFIADEGNNRIREVTTNGTINTVAGDGAQGFDGDGYAPTLAKLNNPSCVAIDNSGNLFIADFSNNRIRK